MNTKPYELLGSGAGVILTALQTEHVFQIISLVLTILSILFSLSFTIYKWYKKAKEDGKIDEKELDELTEIVTDEMEKFKRKDKDD